MSRRDEILELLRATFASVEKLDHIDQDVIYRATLDHVRARRPESVGYLSQLPPPGPIRDPRGGQ